MNVTQDGVPGDNSNKKSYKSGVQGDLSLQNDEGFPHRPNPETRLTTQAEPQSLIYLVFDLETTGLFRPKYDIFKLASIMLNYEGIMVKDSIFTPL